VSCYQSKIYKSKIKMSVAVYKLVRAIGYPWFFLSSRVTMLHREHADRTGAYLLAPTHMSPYDVPCLMRVAPRDLDFLSIVEFYERPWTTRLFRAMNCVFCDRARPDPAATRQILQRLSRGRVVTMFPEAHVRPEDKSVVVGASFRPGVVKLAQMSGTPVIPCVILDTSQYRRFLAWMPIRRTRYGVALGAAIDVHDGDDPAWARDEALARLKQSYRDLYVELCDAMGRTASPVIE
jgi:1-acyl-sn-glycerol-3-phosphate acyltransferase